MNDRLKLTIAPMFKQPLTVLAELKTHCVEWATAKNNATNNAQPSSPLHLESAKKFDDINALLFEKFRRYELQRQTVMRDYVVFMSNMSMHLDAQTISKGNDVLHAAAKADPLPQLQVGVGS